MPQYSDKVMDHFMHPRNVGEMEDPDGVGRIGNPVCVPGNTLIYSNPNISEIKELSESKKVLSHDGKYNKILKTHNRNYFGNLYNIIVHNLGKTSCTPEHHILALKTSSFDHKYKAHKNLIPDWYSAEELVKGDIVLYPIPKEAVDKKYLEMDIKKSKWDFKSKKLPKRIKVNPDFMRLIGYYLAEGYVRTDKSKGTLGFVFNSKEVKYIADINYLMRKIFGLSENYSRTKNHATSITYYQMGLAKFFAQHFGKGAANKRIPHWALKLPLKKQGALIRGFWRGDGYIKSDVAKYVTISKTLAFQIRVLLLRQKIIFSFLTNPAYDIHKESYSIYVKNLESIKKLSKIVGISIKNRTKLKDPKKSWYDDNYYYVPIRKIEKSRFSGTVYNLEVDKSHSYVSNSLCLHNCGDIMEMYIKVKDNVIVDAKFKTFGCGAAIATSSMATELVKGKTIDEALKLTNKAVAEALEGLPPVKMHCSVLAEDALKSAIDDYLKKTTGQGLPGFKPHED